MNQEENGQGWNNPFAKMDISKFPPNRQDRQYGKTHFPKIDSKDRELFLRAYDNLKIRKPADKTGFALSEQCELPILSKVKKKQKKTVEEVVEEPISLPREPEEDPFTVAMRSVRSLDGRGRRIAQKPVLRPAIVPPEDTLEDFMAGRLEFAISSTGEYLEGHVAGMDDLLLNRLREGQFSPEAHLDLHGLNADQAFESLRDFMRQAWLKDLRVVLLVPGRGRNSPDGFGILRQKLQVWLTREPFKRIVLAFCTAKPRDGGPGSIYVLLRRFRKKGPVQWDRIFIDDD